MKPTAKHAIAVLAVAFLAAPGAGCSERKEQAEQAEQPAAENEATPGVFDDPARAKTAEEAAPEMERGPVAAPEDRAVADKLSGRDGKGEFDEGGKADKKPRPAGRGKRRAQTRAWFPETFLFAPLVVTDQGGQAQVDVEVPDRLTTWRVLGLAHSRGGSQAGAVTTFLATLPSYVDPVVPPFLYAGDRVRLPIQLVNTTAEPVSSQLSLEATGAALSGGAGALTLAGRSSVVRYVTLTAERPGIVKILATLDQADSVQRSVEIRPLGRPVIETRSGTLAAPRSLDIAPVADSDPTLARARLLVFPGALAILRSELASSQSRTGGMAEDAFSLLLAGTAPQLLRALGDVPDEADADALRRLTIVATQRVVRHARVLTMTSATLLARAALAHPGNPVIERLGQRAVGHLASKQAPDGTCGGETGWSLQRLLVATADCARAAVGQKEVVLRASGVFERRAQMVEDPYTAAAILAAGAATEEMAQTLRELVRGAIKERTDGAKYLAVPPGVVRADGRVPSTVEATALAVLALTGAEGADVELADMGATLLAGYSPARGWGDGRANLVCMEAVLSLFKTPIPQGVKVTLSVDGQIVAEGELDRERVREVVILEAAVPERKDAARGSADAGGKRTWQVRAEPAVPGLGFSLAVKSWVDWGKGAETGGLEIAVSPAKTLQVGKLADLTVRATAPSGRPLRVEVALPAGVQIDKPSLEELVTDNVLTRYEASDGRVVLHAKPLPPAQTLTADFRVIPTLAGTLSSGPAFLILADRLADPKARTHAPPSRWTIR